jgi:hypothetical protein
MALSYHHQIVAPNLHKFTFASESRPGVYHELLLDLEAEGPDRLSCLCEAAMYGKMCKHKRLVIRGEPGRTGFGHAGLRWVRRRGGRPRPRPRSGRDRGRGR